MGKAVIGRRPFWVAPLAGAALAGGAYRWLAAVLEAPVVGEAPPAAEAAPLRGRVAPAR